MDNDAQIHKEYDKTQRLNLRVQAVCQTIAQQCKQLYENLGTARHEMKSTRQTLNASRVPPQRSQYTHTALISPEMGRTNAMADGQPELDEEVRKTQEQQRERAEQRRTEAEIQRTEAEQGREKAEHMRDDAEVVRLAAEEQRKLTEELRQTTELMRISGDNFAKAAHDMLNELRATLNEVQGLLNELTMLKHDMLNDKDKKPS